MNEANTWKPSALPPGMAFDDERQPVPVVEPVYFDDAPESIESSRAEVVRELGAFLEDGPPWSMAVRLAALKYHWRMSDLSQREAAKKAGCALATLNRTIRQVERYFQRRTGEKMEHPPHV
jgi:hypothetical protein